MGACGVDSTHGWNWLGRPLVIGKPTWSLGEIPGTPGTARNIWPNTHEAAALACILYPPHRIRFLLQPPPLPSSFLPMACIFLACVSMIPGTSGHSNPDSARNPKPSAMSTTCTHRGHCETVVGACLASCVTWHSRRLLAGGDMGESWPLCAQRPGPGRPKDIPQLHQSVAAGRQHALAAGRWRGDFSSPSRRRGLGRSQTSLRMCSGRRGRRRSCPTTPGICSGSFATAS